VGGKTAVNMWFIFIGLWARSEPQGALIKLAPSACVTVCTHEERKKKKNLGIR